MKMVRPLSLGLVLAGLCGLTSPALAHKPRVCSDAGDGGGEMEEAWAAFNCEEDTCTVWAAVYRDGGRQVEYILPSGDLRPSHGSAADPSRWVKH